MAELDLLRTFLAVYRAGSFTRAAADLHLTQPAVSNHVRSLEQQVGRTLFQRGARGATPTDAGEELARAAGPHLDALDGVLGRAEDEAATLADTVYLGGPEEFFSERIVPVVAPLIAAGQRVRMHFDVDQPVVEQLATHDLDIAITTNRWRRRGLDAEFLCNEYLVLVGSPEWAERLGRVTSSKRGARTLERAPLVAFGEDLPLVSDYWRAVFDATAAHRAIAVTNSLRSALRLAVSGAGVTVLPAHVCDGAIRRGELVRLHKPSEPPRNRLWLMWRTGALARPSIARVHTRIREAATDWE